MIRGVSGGEKKERGEAALLVAARLDWGGMEADGEFLYGRRRANWWLVGSFMNLGHILQRRSFQMGCKFRK